MSVELEPAELGFKRPFQQEVSQTLRLKNPHSDPVAFKVKTTAPKQYCVRPNSGRIDPGDAVEVQVLLQAMKEDPPLDAKCRDKFLVQSVAVTADREFTNVAQVWSNIEQTAKSSIQEKKIRVVFLPADDAAGTPKTNGSRHEEDHSMLGNSPEAVTPQRGVTAEPVGSVSRPEQRPAGNKSLGGAKESVHNPATSGASGTSGIQSTISAAAAGVANAVPTSGDVQHQLDEARATIGRLRQQLEQSTSGLRQRKAEPASQDSKGGVATAIQQAPAGGVPVQIVAGLCLLSFLLAYFFF